MAYRHVVENGKGLGKALTHWVSVKGRPMGVAVVQLLGILLMVKELHGAARPLWHWMEVGILCV